MTTLFLWLSALVPLTFSAGPANVTMAAVGGRFGLRGALPFYLGINLVVLCSTLAIGFGVSRVMQDYLAFFPLLQWAGALYMFYLAYRIIRSARVEQADDSSARPRFVDGVVLQLLNVKMVMVDVMMFSQFLEHRESMAGQVILLTLGLLTLTLTANALWATGGAWLTRMFASERSVRLQGYLFGGMLAAVGVWMCFQTASF